MSIRSPPVERGNRTSDDGSGWTAADWPSGESSNAYTNRKGLNVALIADDRRSCNDRRSVLDSVDYNSWKPNYRFSCCMKAVKEDIDTDLIVRARGNRPDVGSLSSNLDEGTTNELRDDVSVVKNDS